MIGIADTGFLVALLNRRDKYHAWAASFTPVISVPLLTCESVLSETTFHLGDANLVFGLLRSHFIEIAFDCRDHLKELEQIAAQFADQQPDFADLCLIRMSELHPYHPVLTIDRNDFRVYRRNRSELIPVNCPPD